MLSSIKMRFVALYFLLFSILFFILGLFLYYQIENTLMASVDGHLHSEMQLISGLLDVEEGYHEIALSEAEVGEYALPLSGHYYQVISSKGDIVARSPSLSIVDAELPPAQESLEPLYDTITGPDKGPLRILSQTFNLRSMTLTIQVGETLEETYELIASFRNMIIIVFPSFFIISLLGLIIITRYSLKRVDTFSDKVGKITEKNLKERLEVVGVESELRLLAESFNTMMERIEESFERQKQFMSDASHDLRTPVSVVKSYCDVTLMQERPAEEYKEALTKISAMANKMAHIINRILEVARLDSEAFLLNLSKIDLKEIAGNVVKALETNASDKGVKINFSGDSLAIQGDRERLTDAISNIVDNAIKYNRPEGTVSINVREEEGWAIVAVSDSGMGMKANDVDKIFERFHRIDASRGLVEGSGLGLPIVKRIIEMHKGKIEVESEIGKGSCFTISLPVEVKD
ncbi:MAG: HAMP domain-containing protein [Proteobacteria bacterium]|nr:HAMP domain-containing protein [Pseudomonadota bacterium]